MCLESHLYLTPLVIMPIKAKHMYHVSNTILYVFEMIVSVIATIKYWITTNVK